MRELIFSEHDRLGFWETDGYHTRGDPWPEERYRETSARPLNPWRGAQMIETA